MLTEMRLEECELDCALIGKRVRTARKAKKVTQEELSEHCGCTPTHICNRHRSMTGRELADALWPDADYTDPTGKLRTLLYRFRTTFRLFSDKELIVTSANGYERGILYAQDVYDGFSPEIMDTLHLIAIPIGVIPDPSVSMEDMEKYGYTYIWVWCRWGQKRQANTSSRAA